MQSENEEQQVALEFLHHFVSIKGSLNTIKDMLYVGHQHDADFKDMLLMLVNDLEKILLKYEK